MSIAARIRGARLAAGLTQAQLAARIGGTPDDVWRYEAGLRSPSIHRLREICLACGVSADAILGLKECLDPDCRRTVEVTEARTHCAA